MSKYEEPRSRAAFARPASVDTTSGSCPDGDSPIPEQDGMSYREWVAGMVLAAIAGSDKISAGQPLMVVAAIRAADLLAVALQMPAHGMTNEDILEALALHIQSRPR